MAAHETDQLRIELEREKWRDEVRLREREIEIKEREQRNQEEELRLKRREQDRSRWTNPLVLAVLAAAVAAAGNAFTVWLTAHEQRSADLTKADSTREADANKSEADRILEVIKTNNDPDKAATNLKFLVDAGLILNPKTKGPLQTYLKTRQPGEGVALPSPTTSPSSAPTSVTGGIAATGSDWPWLVVLSTKKSNLGEFCHGTALSPTIVLTSAHCTAQSKPEDIKVLRPSGAQPLERAPSIPVAKIIVHPGFSVETDQNDIAILVLDGQLSPPFVTISSQRSTDPPPGTLALVAAFDLFVHG